MALFRIRRPASGSHSDGSEQGTSRSARNGGARKNAGKAIGCNPYDTGLSAPKKPRGVVREGARPRASGADNPYNNLESSRRKRSWDDAFIDTWVEHKKTR